MNWNEFLIARAISRELLARSCVVLVDRCNWTGHECDVLAVTKDLRLIDVEVKISRADLKADAKKDKWWRSQRGVYDEDGRQLSISSPDGPGDILNLHPLKIWKHYYALPAEIWKPELLQVLPSMASGVLLIDRPLAPRFKVIRRAIPARDAYRLKPAEVIDIARLANLRMWDAYAQQDKQRRLLPFRPLTYGARP